MRAKIQETSTFLNLDALQQKIYSSKSLMEKTEHCYRVADLRGLEFMVQTQSPTSTTLKIVKELLTK
jgi:hypothetical protein